MDQYHLFNYDMSQYSFNSANNPFGKLGNMEEEVAVQLYSILQRIGLWGLILSVLILGIAFVVNSSDPRKRDELKKRLLIVAGSGVLIFGFLEGLGWILQLLKI